MHSKKIQHNYENYFNKKLLDFYLESFLSSACQLKPITSLFKFELYNSDSDAQFRLGFIYEQGNIKMDNFF